MSKVGTEVDMAVGNENSQYNYTILRQWAELIKSDKVCFTGLCIYGHNFFNFTYIGTTITSLYKGVMWFHHNQKLKDFYKD